jgi:uncharacterized protein
MIGNRPTKDDILRYVVYTYLLFGLLLLIFGALAVVLLHGAPLAMRWLIAVTAWTPTYVFLLMFRKLYPGGTLRNFYKKAFGTRLNIGLLVVTTSIQLAIYAASVSIVSAQKGIPFRRLLDLSAVTLMSALFFTLIQGATGEETGWRGYLQQAIEEKVGPVKGSLIVGLIWAFWHAPIWFLGSGYGGAVLARYVVSYVICIASVGFVMGIAYHHCRNLLIPVWIHFMLNFPGESFVGPKVDMITWYAVFYALMASGFLLWHNVADRKSGSGRDGQPRAVATTAIRPNE